MLSGPYSCCRRHSEHPCSPIRRESQLAGQGQLPWAEEQRRVQFVLSSRWEQAYPVRACPGWHHGNGQSALSSAPPNDPWLPSPFLQELTICVGQEVTTAAAAHSHCIRVRSLPLPAAVCPPHGSLSFPVPWRTPQLIWPLCPENISASS